MNKKMVLLAGISLALTAGVVSCVSSQSNFYREPASLGFFQSISDSFSQNPEDFNDKSAARHLSDDDIAKISSSGQMKLTNGEVIVDNDAAFNAKLSAIQSAKSSIAMSYFIYSDDDSSSLITNALIQKAQKGVKVELLVDFITNIGRLDLFQMMEDEGHGNLQVRFYNFPSARIIGDAKYMTLPCPSVRPGEKVGKHDCEKAKQKIMAATASQDSTFFSRLMLSGLYSKNGVALKTALGLGADFDPAAYKASASGNSSAEESVQLLQFFKLYIDAKVHGDIGAMIELTIAGIVYADKLDPVINQLTGRIPTIGSDSVPGSVTTHSQEWDHLTDYTHHKLLLVDDHIFQLGGRNVEDSYHMKTHLDPSKGKYIFMDTDFRGMVRDASGIRNSFNAMFGFSEMVAKLKTVQHYIPADLMKNNVSLSAAALKCSEAGNQPGTQAMSDCVETKMQLKDLGFTSQAQRSAQAKADMLASMASYNTQYMPARNLARDTWKSNGNGLSASDVSSAEVYYVENTTFDVKADPSARIRRTGAKIGSEKFFNKHIHQAWYRGLENVCATSNDMSRNNQQGEIRVVFHSAYMFLPSGLLHKITKMLNGDYGDCSHVHLTLLTNSFETTDLNVINIFARYQMIELFHFYKALASASGSKHWYPKLDYYDYKAQAAGTGISLHTKTTLLGDDIVIGSANADDRSYAMDTNNAVFIRNAPDLTRDYKTFVDGIIADSDRTKNWSDIYAGMSATDIQQENEYILGAMICRWDKKATNCPADGKISVRDVQSPRLSGNDPDPAKREQERQKRVEDLLGTLDKVGKEVTDFSRSMLQFRGEFNEIIARYTRPSSGKPANDNSNISQRSGQVDMDLNRAANAFDDLFKVL